ncbi:hypothetical protein RSOLAG22IIIB_09914 [Rhizoctonia solani]|uniref:Calcineurin-like phosphoesterase domain-containing protein n=1 Tax=Rhizoctonia solani TaxID=456999 RepID=A0A0K6G069_9AGAM|nr:hypothetical protein RSOLAG22IIIB_09914 [Rhizoctonia solani]
MASSPITIPVIHFNDVYEMTRSVKTAKNFRLTDDEGKLHDNFDHVIGFSRKIEEIRESWTGKQQEGVGKKREGLLLFSGDIFSPSVESTLTEGRNMVHLMNELAPDACVPGNHEFDFSRERFNQLVESCNFPWVLSNAEEQTKDGWTTLKYLHRYTVLEAGPDEQKLRIGIIGLISADTVSKTNSQARGTFRLCEPNSNENEEMKKKCMKLAAELRGEPEKCDLVFALTHGVFDEDIDLGKHANCYTVGDFSSLGKGVLKDTPGIDLILGGHDHEYFLGKGVKLIETTFPEGKRDPAKTQGALDNDDGLL